MSENERKIVLFDGLCHLCNSSVDIIIKHDKSGKFKFAPLQSKTGNDLLMSHGISPAKTNSIIFIEGNNAWIESTAALRISKHLDGIFKVGIIFLIIPRFLRDGIYKWIARNRYKWFGKRSECRVPTAEIRERFL